MFGVLRCLDTPRRVHAHQLHLLQPILLNVVIGSSWPWNQQALSHVEGVKKHLGLQEECKCVLLATIKS